MDSIRDFLAHAICLERDAAERFSTLADLMRSYGNHDVATFFAQMSEYSRLHLATARARAGYRDVPDVPCGGFEFPGGVSPEAVSGEADHYLMTVDYALSLALESEKRGLAFYRQVAETTKDRETRELALEFVAEEEEHVVALEQWVARYAA